MGVVEIGDFGFVFYYYFCFFLCVGVVFVVLFCGLLFEWMMKSFSMGLFIVILGELVLMEKG